MVRLSLPGGLSSVLSRGFLKTSDPEDSLYFFTLSCLSLHFRRSIHTSRVPSRTPFKHVLDEPLQTIEVCLIVTLVDGFGTRPNVT